MIITDSLHQTRTGEMSEHKLLLLSAIPGSHLSKQPWHRLRCEFQKRKHHHYGFSTRKGSPEDQWLYSQLGMIDSPRGLTHIEECIRLQLAFPFYEAGSNQARPSLLSLPICSWTGTPMHCLNIMKTSPKMYW